jgi:aminoglycoside/choline kinase family phosphotransferase
LSLWLDELAHDVAAHPVRICHRDYHLNNLMLLADGEVGIIDIQDILIGPDSYDVVSLLGERAATGFIGADQRRALLERWADLTGAGPGWQDRVAQVQAQRNLKVIGTFARFLACGRREYGPWLQGLIEGLPDRLSSVAVPTDVAAFLID